MRYIENSMKESLWKSRDIGASRVYDLTPTTKIPPQKVLQTVSPNKATLVDLLYEDLINHKEEFQENRLIITGSHRTPDELYYKGLETQRRDLETRPEEADTPIPHQLSSGCDTAPPHYGIGKRGSSKRSKKQKTSSKCFGRPQNHSKESDQRMSRPNSCMLRRGEVSKNIPRSPMLKSPPPTGEALT